MKFNWTWQHTAGLAMGIILPLLVVPLLILFLSWVQGYEFEQLWYKFTYNRPYRVRMITLSIIANLPVFYYFLNRERYNIGYGIIFGSIFFAPYIIYIKFF